MTFEELLRGNKMLFCGHGLKFPSTSLRDTNSKTILSPVICFLAQYCLKSASKAPTVELLRLNSLRDIKTAFLIPER